MDGPVADSAPALPQQIVRLSDQGARQAASFELTPDEGERQAIAAALGIVAVKKLRFAGRLSPADRQDWTLEAELGATVVQNCVVTLEPVTSRIDEAVTRRYLARFEEPEAGEVEMPEDDTAEPLPRALDLVAVMMEALSLALPPFPRAEGADLGEAVFAEPGTAPMTDEEAKPFAGLAGLRARLEDKD